MPSYKNPPIEEALCEFTFALPNSAPPWDLALPGKYQMHDSIREIYAGTVKQQMMQTIVVDNIEMGVAV